MQEQLHSEFGIQRVSIAHKTDIMVKVLIKCMCELSIIGANIKSVGPNRLVVRTTRCGRVDPGSNPGSGHILSYVHNIYAVI